MKRLLILCVVTVALISGAAFVASRSPKAILARQFNLTLPKTAREPHAFVESELYTRTVRVWFNAKLPIEDARLLVSALQLAELPPKFGRYTGVPDAVGSWWLDESASPKSDVERHVWMGGTGEFIGGFNYAVWENNNFYLFRQGIQLGK